MNPDLVFVVSSVIIGVSLPAAFYAGIRAGTNHAEADRSWLRSELVAANDRLFAVSREPGAVIPARTEPPVPIEPLPRELEILAGDFESASVQETLRSQFRALMAEGVSPPEIIRRHLES